MDRYWITTTTGLWWLEGTEFSPLYIMNRNNDFYVVETDDDREEPNNIEGPFTTLDAAKVAYQRLLIIEEMLAYEAKAFDNDEPINGADLVSAFADWRRRLKDIER